MERTEDTFLRAEKTFYCNIKREPVLLEKRTLASRRRVDYPVGLRTVYPTGGEDPIQQAE